MVNNNFFKVSLQDRFNSYVCAGVLLDPLHIVTAGHCYQGRKPIVIKKIV